MGVMPVCLPVFCATLYRIRVFLPNIVKVVKFPYLSKYWRFCASWLLTSYWLLMVEGGNLYDQSRMNCVASGTDV